MYRSSKGRFLKDYVFGQTVAMWMERSAVGDTARRSLNCSDQLVV